MNKNEMRKDVPPGAEFPDAGHVLQVASIEPATENLMSLDPREDGWDTEFLNQQVNQQLQALAAALATVRAGRVRIPDSLLATDSRCSVLVPQTLETVFEDTILLIERESKSPARDARISTSDLGPRLSTLFLPHVEARDVHAKFKVVRVSRERELVTTEQLFALSFRTDQEMVEQHATWTITWTIASDGQLPRMKEILATQYERVTARNGGKPLFADCTVSAFRHLPRIFQQQYGVGIPNWTRRLEAFQEVYQFGHNGLAVGDVDGDGMDDLYSCQVGGLPNRLFLANADGTLRDASAEAGVDFLDNTRSALLVDLDNDGDQDLVLALSAYVLVMENDGGGQFSTAARIDSVRQVFSLAAADFDEDGDLDLYACVYYPDHETMAELPIPMPVYNATNGGRNVLLRNNTGWQFRDVTAETGLDQNNSRFSYAAVWEDYDNDSDLDLFVANDFGRNNLYQSDAGRFRDVTEKVGMVDDAFGMSAATGDYNRDGWMDFYKANMFSSAGNRVTRQPKFMPEAAPDHRLRFQHLARGNTLFENTRGQFRDMSVERGVTMGRWSWGSLFVDFNNDGWEDLFVTNGFVTGPQPDDL